MNLLVFQTPEGEWCCDCKDFPGSPLIGRGNNKYEAMGRWLEYLQYQSEFWKYLKQEV